MNTSASHTSKPTDGAGDAEHTLKDANVPGPCDLENTGEIDAAVQRSAHYCAELVRCMCWKVRLHSHLGQKVVLRVLMQRSDGAGRTKPRVDAAHTSLPQHTVVRCHNVGSQGRDLFKQLMLGQVQQLSLMLMLMLMHLLSLQPLCCCQWCFGI